MRVTIIPADRMVYVDGDARRVHDHVEFHKDVHAVQWYHDHGEIEYEDGRPNKPIDNLDDFKHHLAHHTAAFERDKKQEAEDAEAARKAVEAAKQGRDQLADLFRRVEVLESIIVQKAPSSNVS